MKDDCEGKAHKELAPIFYQFITADFCSDCKRKAKDADTCKEFELENGICASFEWKSDKRKVAYEKRVLENWGVSRWLDKGKSLQDIYAMSEDKLLSVLTKKELRYFEPDGELVKASNTKSKKKSVNKGAPEKPKAKCYDLLGNPIYRKGVKKDMYLSPKSPMPVTKPDGVSVRPITASKNTIDPAAVGKDFHLFHCKKPDGKAAVYKRSISAPSYLTEIVAFRKDLAKRGIAITSEEYVIKEDLERK